MYFNVTNGARAMSEPLLYGFSIGISFNAALRPPVPSHLRARRACPEGICSYLTAVTLQSSQRAQTASARTCRVGYHSTVA